MAVESLQSRAESHLAYIREAMFRARTFTAIPGWGGVWMGGVGVVAAVIGARATSEAAWLQTWLVAAALAIPIGALSLHGKARRAGLGLGSETGRLFLAGLTPPIVSGGVLTLALVDAGFYRLLPATWLLLYGTATVVGGAFSVRPVLWMGAGFMALGATAAFVSPSVGNLLLGAGFGLLHILCGLVIVRRFGG